MYLHRYTPIFTRFSGYACCFFLVFSVSKILPSAWTSNPAIIEHIADEAADLVCKFGRVGVGAREGVYVYKLHRKYAFMNICD